MILGATPIYATCPEQAKPETEGCRDGLSDGDDKLFEILPKWLHSSMNVLKTTESVALDRYNGRCVDYSTMRPLKKRQEAQWWIACPPPPCDKKIIKAAQKTCTAGAVRTLPSLKKGREPTLSCGGRPLWRTQEGRRLRTPQKERAGGRQWATHSEARKEGGEHVAPVMVN